MKGYLLVVDDTHADPEYQFFWDLVKALEAASDTVEKCCRHYKFTSDECDYTPCGGSNGYWFSAQSPCGSFKINVRKINIPEIT